METQFFTESEPFVIMVTYIALLVLIVSQFSSLCVLCNESYSESTNNSTANTLPQQKPNIVVFMADDLGRGDVSFTEGSLQTATPNIDRLAFDGIVLNRHYSQSTCTPTRSAFLTAKYAFNVGMQTVIAPGEPWGLPLQFKIQPQFWKTMNYSTYMVGKWHVGMFQRAYYPGRRGFDYSFIMEAGEANWFNYTTGWITPVPTSGRSVRENGKMVFANVTNNFYLPDLFTTKAEQLIKDSDPEKPFFMYFATPLTHVAYEDYRPVQHTMPQYSLRPSVLKFTNQFPERKKYLAVVQALDESFKRITDALINRGTINNTIIAFISDNGAPLVQFQLLQRGSNHGSNWPLRLGKSTLFEGGIRTAAFIWSPLLKRRGRISDQLFHVTDWFPTLWEAAGGNVTELGLIDGQSQWTSLKAGSTTGPRKELPTGIVHKSTGFGEQYGMIFTDQYGTLFKYIKGNIIDNTFTGWNRPEGTVAGDDSWKSYSPASINCVFPEGEEVNECKPWIAPCLFDISFDQCETNNIAEAFPDIVAIMEDKIRAYNATAFYANKPFDIDGIPSKWNGLWVPWKDPVETYDTVPLAFSPFSPSTI